MYTVNDHTYEMLVEKQSKFIAHIMPYSRYDEVLESLKAEHPKARHFVTAFRYINEFDQVVEGSSDDGEPRGTSGKPTLAVLQGNTLINAAIITVRYFGGTKLGTGGLVRAYSDATNMAIDASLLYTLPVGIAAFRHYGWTEPAITFGYTQCSAEVRAARQNLIDAVEATTSQPTTL